MKTNTLGDVSHSPNALETVKHLGKLKDSFTDAEQEADHKIEELVKWFRTRNISYPVYGGDRGMTGGAETMDKLQRTIESYMGSKYGANLTKRNDYIRKLEARKQDVLRSHPEVANRKASPTKELDIYEDYSEKRDTSTSQRYKAMPYKPAAYEQRPLSERTDTLSELDVLLGRPESTRGEDIKPGKSTSKKGSGHMIGGENMGAATASVRPKMGRHRGASSLYGGSEDLEIRDSGGYYEWPENTLHDRMSVGRQITANRMGPHMMAGGSPLAAAAAASDIIASVGDAGSKLAESIGNQIDQSRRTLFEIEKQNGELENMMTRKRAERAEEIDKELDQKIHERWHKFAKFSPPQLALPRFGLTQDDLYRYEHNQALGSIAKGKIEKANDALYQYLLKKRRLNENFETPEEIKRQEALQLKLDTVKRQLDNLGEKAEDLGLSGTGASIDDTDESPDGKLNRAYMQKLFNVMQKKRHEMMERFPEEKLRLSRFGITQPNGVNDPEKRDMLNKADDALTKHVLKKHGSGAYAKKHKNMFGEKHVFRGHGEPWYAEDVHSQEELKKLFPNPDMNIGFW